MILSFELQGEQRYSVNVFLNCLVSRTPFRSASASSFPEGPHWACPLSSMNAFVLELDMQLNTCPGSYCSKNTDGILIWKKKNQLSSLECKGLGARTSDLFFPMIKVVAHGRSGWRMQWPVWGESGELRAPSGSICARLGAQPGMHRRVLLAGVSDLCSCQGSGKADATRLFLKIWFPVLEVVFNWNRGERNN